MNDTDKESTMFQAGQIVGMAALNDWHRIETLLDKIKADARRSAMMEAAEIVKKRRENYIEEHGAYDLDTGVTEFPGTGLETVMEWVDIEDAILAAIEPEKEKQL